MFTAANIWCLSWSKWQGLYLKFGERERVRARETATSLSVPFHIFLITFKALGLKVFFQFFPWLLVLMPILNRNKKLPVVSWFWQPFTFFSMQIPDLILWLRWCLFRYFPCWVITTSLSHNGCQVSCNQMLVATTDPSALLRYTPESGWKRLFP